MSKGTWLIQDGKKVAAVRDGKTVKPVAPKPATEQKTEEK